MTNLKNPVEAFLHWESIQPDKIFFNQPIKGKIKTYTYKEAGLEIRKIAQGLKNLNILRKR